MPEPGGTRRNQAGTRGGIWMEPGVDRNANTPLNIFVSIDIHNDIDIEISDHIQGGIKGGMGGAVRVEVMCF